MTVVESARELAWIMRRGMPMSATQLFYCMMMPVTLAFCGALGTEDLDAAGLSLSIFQLTVENCASSVRWGLMPFLAQTIGGSKKHRVGNFVQRGLLTSVLLTCFNWTLVMNAGNLLILLGQDPVISVKAERFLIILMPGSLSMNLYDALNAYTDAVGYLWPTFVVRCVSLGANTLLQYLLVTVAGLGLTGSALGLSISLCLLPILQTAFIWGLNIHRDTWSGWSTRAFMDWGKFLYTVMPCLLTQSLWYLGTEYGNFLAGLIGKAEIAAESVLFQLNVIAFLIPVGIGSALISRIGYYLSTQQPEKLVRLVLTSLAFMGTMGAVIGIIFFLLRYEVPRIFSLEPEATELYVAMSPYLSIYTAFQLAAYPSIAALRACNSHLHTLLMNVIGYYVIGAPLGISLAFAAGWGLNGLWVGFATSSVSFFILLAICALRLDWRGRATTAHFNAEMETDMELISERRPLLPEPEPSEPTGSQENTAKAASSYLLSASTNGAKQRNAVRSKLPVLFGLVTLLAASLTLRLLVPPQVPDESGHHGNASAIVIDASSMQPSFNATILA
ncbi:hypothetical protein BOX15_Mlig003014g2 [Macrostomum lignano]|uniref:Multidrug and toxin extrusion protein n=1 Tax=Macrostomum lignano TaxID=282301 RepID=A0A267DXC0_9PLAT|nr:hypothetical protein BOX15_Mlig003014g3 [Macrostomum lignano]PAA53941.1 hypothetical protein BOX15_Mlig003014g2 [Macrostomum lignano]